MGDNRKMASSGIAPAPECADKWALVKNPKGAENDVPVRGYTFKFTPKRDLIVPDAAIPKTEDFKADWDKFVETLPPKDVMYAAYEFDFKDIGSGYNDGDLDAAPIKTKLIVVSWAPDSAKPQMNDLDDAQYESVCAKLGIKL